MLYKSSDKFEKESGTLDIDESEYQVSDVSAVLKRYYDNVKYYSVNSNTVQFAYKDKKLKE